MTGPVGSERPLRIGAAATVLIPAAAAPAPLRDELRQVLPGPPRRAGSGST